MQSEDFNGPVTNLRTESMWLHHDPLGIRRNSRWDFQHEVADAFETSSQASVQIDGKDFLEGSTYNDFYGFGTCADAALDENADDWFKEFSGRKMDVVVRTTLTRFLCFFDDKAEVLYRGTRIYRVPHRWHFPEGSDQTSRSEQVFTVWKNGEKTAEGVALASRIKEIVEADICGGRRKRGLNVVEEGGLLFAA